MSAHLSTSLSCHLSTRPGPGRKKSFNPDAERGCHAKTHPPRYLTNVILGLIIRHYRELQNLTQEYIAERAGCYPSYLSLIENGRADLSIKTFDRLCKALQVSANLLYYQAELLECEFFESPVGRPHPGSTIDPLAALLWFDERLRRRLPEDCES